MHYSYKQKILIFSLQMCKLESLISFVDNFNRERNPPDPWQIIELQRYDIVDIPIARFALICTEMPPPEFELFVEGYTAHIPQYCPYCLKEDGKLIPLAPQNRSGVCFRHSDRQEKRKLRKRSPKNNKS